MKSTFTVLRHEDQAGYDALLASFHEEFHPETAHECFLVELMVHARWRMARLQRIEAASLDALVSPGADPKYSPEHLISFNLGNGAGATLATLQRLVSAAERTYFKAHSELLHYRQMRKEAKTVETLDAAVVKRVVTAPPTRRPQILQNEPKPSNRFVMAAPDNPALRL